MQIAKEIAVGSDIELIKNLNLHCRRKKYQNENGSSNVKMREDVKMVKSVSIISLFIYIVMNCA